MQGRWGWEETIVKDEDATGRTPSRQGQRGSRRGGAERGNEVSRSRGTGARRRFALDGRAPPTPHAHPRIQQDRNRHSQGIAERRRLESSYRDPSGQPGRTRRSRLFV